jgi:hypothetical protein
MEEIWKLINDYDFMYEVSSIGNVRRVDTKKPKIPGLVGGDRNRVQFMFQIKGNIFRAYAHQLVARAFIPNIDMKPHINHIDNNPLNNNVSNLEWCTHQENMDHMNKQNRSRNIPRPGIKHHNCKLTEKQVLEIFISSDVQNKIAKKYGVRQTHISRIKLGQRWGHLTKGVDYKNKQFTI